MNIINGNILDIERGVICHQVNCRGVMGAGIALHIRNKWPHVYADYREAFRKRLLFLGNIVTSEAAPNLYVAHLCGQDRYGREPGKVYTNYVALAGCMNLLAASMINIKASDRPIYVPYGMGCVNAGGDWRIVHDLISNLMPDATIVKLG